MKTLLLIIVGGIGLYLFGCNDSDKEGPYPYDAGYEAAWEGKTKPKKSSSSYNLGYKEGMDDSFIDQQGLWDGEHAREPLYPKDDLYMRSYMEGKSKSWKY
ncbi:hypothetical protein LCGC14_1035620 [marine sediment metagenome]|uniref:Uncharacterized protein n=1 Tax=marine sediment metagenome TaxID=412755 RepID=A0A0F9NEY3_9ZZZZ